MLQQLGNYSDGCPTEGETDQMATAAAAPARYVCSDPARCACAGKCQSQEASLALLWTLGIFTLNCGPVVMGFVLDFLGPKLTGILGGSPAWPDGFMLCIRVGN
jgi:hypothetical protein